MTGGSGKINMATIAKVRSESFLGKLWIGSSKVIGQKADKDDRAGLFCSEVVEDDNKWHKG